MCFLPSVLVHIIFYFNPLSVHIWCSFFFHSQLGNCPKWMIRPSEIERKVHLFQYEVYFLSYFYIVANEVSNLCLDPELGFLLGCHEMNSVKMNYLPDVSQGKYPHLEIFGQFVWWKLWTIHSNLYEWLVKVPIPCFDMFIELQNLLNFFTDPWNMLAT